MSVEVFLIGVVGFFAAGILSEYLFRRFQIPDAAWLILLGILVGPVFGLIESRDIDFIVPYFGAIALIVILFDGGSSLSLTTVKETVGRSSLLAVLTFIAGTVLVAIVSWVGSWTGLVSDWSWLKALMFGCIVGGSSSIIIIPTVNLAKLKPKLVNLVSIESAITDALCIVGTYLLISTILQIEMAHGESVSFAELIGKTAGFGALIGILSGIVWLLVLPFLKGSYNYVITISYLLLVYVISSKVGGSPAFSVLLFAIIVGNAQQVSKILRLEGYRSMKFEVQFLNSQLAFVIKVFFFILMGILIQFSWEAFIFAALITGAIILSRVFMVPMTLKGFDLSPAEKKFVITCFPRGLAAGILAILPFESGLRGTENLSQVVFLVVALTTLFFSAGFFATRPKEGPAEEAKDLQMLKPSSDPN